MEVQPPSLRPSPPLLVWRGMCGTFRRSFLNPLQRMNFFFQFQMDEMGGDRTALVGKTKSGKKKKREPGMENPLYGSS